MTRWVIEQANAKVTGRQAIARTPERLVYVARWRVRDTLGLMQLSERFMREQIQAAA